MKFTPVFALLAVCAPIVVPVVAHAQTSEVPVLAPLPMAPMTAATSDAFVWRFAPPVGSRWTMRSFTRSNSLSQLPAIGDEKAQSIKISIIQKMVADYDVLSRDALGATTIRLTLRDMTQDVSSAFGGKIVKAPAPTKRAPKSVNGATLTIKQAPDGKVWGVAGMRAYQRRIYEASGLFDEAMVKQLLDATPMTSGSDMVKSLGGMSGTLPVSPVRMGESWNYDVAFKQLPMTLDITGTRTIKSLDSQIAVIADSATFSGGNSQKKMPIFPGMGDIKIDYSGLSGVMSGTSRVQRSSGLPLESTTNQTIKGQISTRVPAANGVAAQTLVVPLNATASTRVVMEPR